jgi:hypothetical protein
VVYGRDPPQLRAYTAGEAKLPTVDSQLCDRDEFLMEVRERLEQAQQYYKQYYDGKHRISDWVWLRLMHRPLASLNIKDRTKLGLMFFGPFMVTERVRDVASSFNYRRALDCTMCSTSGYSRSSMALHR